MKMEIPKKKPCKHKNFTWHENGNEIWAFCSCGKRKIIVPKHIIEIVQEYALYNFKKKVRDVFHVTGDSL